MKQGKVFSCQVIRFSAKKYVKENNPNSSVDFQSQVLIFTLFLNFSDLSEREGEGQKLICLSFFP